MAVRSRKRRPVSRFVAPVATMMILGYFGFHATNGQYGMRARLVMDKQISQVEAKLVERTLVRNELEKRVALLRDGTMEKDMVDQYVRSQLNMLREDEVAIISVN